MITGMDRLKAALSGETLDRVPVFCNLIDQGARELGLPMREYFSKGEYVAEAQLKMREKYGHDNLWSLFYVGREAELFGSRCIRYSEYGSPNVEDFVIKGLDDIARLEVPRDVATHPLLEEPMKCLRILKKESGGNYPICAYFSSTMTLPSILMGMERWFELLFIGPTNVRDELLRKCHEFFIQEVKAYRENGADIILYSNPFGSLQTVPPRFFKEESLKWIERDIAAIGPSGVVYYCGTSRMDNVIVTVLERTNIQVFYLSPMDDIAIAKRILAGRGLTCGTINDLRLIDSAPGEIREEVRRIMREGTPGGHFLFGTGVMPLGIPETNIRAMLQAAFEYGSCSRSSS